MKGWEIRQKLKPGYRVKVDWSILRNSHGMMFPSGHNVGILSEWYTVEDVSKRDCSCYTRYDCAGEIKFNGIGNYKCLGYAGDKSGNWCPFVDYTDDMMKLVDQELPKKKSLYSRKLRLKVR